MQKLTDEQIHKSLLISDLIELEKDAHDYHFPQFMLDGEMKMTLGMARKFNLEDWFNEVLFRGLDELEDEFVKRS